jgi:hypothetical protein
MGAVLVEQRRHSRQRGDRSWRTLMRWYELARIVHFLGLIALCGFFVIFARNAPPLRRDAG